ncbi:RNA polymerase sigma factor [Pedobacter hiemivivus]|uniref:Sigma-70 family RNA polymerase sigma factor n=1 Tax=Pedobacter hiemivivus TaxID=2530454 RepID=A0A4R0NF02_9SPHI|nr:sigma-70 family RNA polymerase sigma factor [Pedobacter hiemivivus]TCC97174.1 sigma-70 family RNA polymerase sigma factor [Pedobacter hiemivivus]
MKNRIKDQDEYYWVQCFKQGDPDALAYFFDLHYKALCYFAERLIGDEAEAEDIVADCFLKLWKGDRQIETAQNVKAFLYISCRNACMDYFRKLKVKTAAQEYTYRQLEHGEEGIFYEVVKTDVMEILAAEIESLPV